MTEKIFLVVVKTKFKGGEKSHFSILYAERDFMLALADVMKFTAMHKQLMPACYAYRRFYVKPIDFYSL